MSDTTDPPKPAADVLPVALADALGERYLNYALSTIMARSLPDVRDGLKPVHRRVLYAMRELRLAPGSAPKKAARVIGDVIGKYHPHGDVAVYDALVRLAQDFAVRYPLVDGQGNFGNIDGDSPAAMRYTEARLTAVAEALLDGIDEDAVDFRETYDGEGREPVVLPANFPNLLANGAQGIAVGMATSIPPHNVGELCAGLRRLIAEERLGTGTVTVEDLVALIPGPDFPTGGVLVESADTVAEAYRTGRGSLRLRATWHREPLSHGQYQIVITEIPYQVAKAKLVERIADLLNARRLPLLADVRDESAEDVRLILEPRSRSVEPEHLMEQMFKLTDLEVRFGLNMNVLDADQTPKVMGLDAILRAFLDHRLVVLLRQTRHRLGKIAHRIEVLDGYIIAYLNLDEVIRIIREEDEPKPALIAAFDLTDVQAEAILNMRLRALRKLEEMEIRRERDRLAAEQADLEALLAAPDRQWHRLDDEIAAIDERFGQSNPVLGPRRTAIGAPPAQVEVPVEALVEREPITVFLSAMGWVRAVKGHQSDTAAVQYKEGDAERFVLHAETTDKLLLMASTGRFYTLGADKLPRGRGYGSPVRLLIDLPNEAEIVALHVSRPGGQLLVASSDARGFRVRDDDVLAQTKAGKQVLNPAADAMAAACIRVAGDAVAVIGGKPPRFLAFPLDQVPEMTKGRGVILQKLKVGTLVDITTYDSAAGLSWPSGDRTRTHVPEQGARAGQGGKLPVGFPKSLRFP